MTTIWHNEARAEGADDFEASIATALAAHQADLRRLCGWARNLATEGLVRLYTNHGVESVTLHPCLHTKEICLVAVRNHNGAYLALFRTVFEHNAPQALAEVERLIAPERVRHGTRIRDVNDELLDALTAAYREAAGRTSTAR